MKIKTKVQAGRGGGYGGHRNHNQRLPVTKAGHGTRSSAGMVKP
jgi:hypothetical protein